MLGTAARLLVVALLVVGGPVAAADRSPAAAAPRASEVSVDELNLTGVDDDALAELPAQAPPVAEDAVADDAVVEPLADAATTTDAAAPSAAARIVGAAYLQPNRRTGVAPDPAPSESPVPTTTPESTPTPVPSESSTPDAPPAPAPAPTEPLDGTLVPDPDVLTADLEVDPFTVLGVSWRDTADLTDPVIRYRVRQADVWSDWEAVGASDIAPDTGSRDDRGSRRGATDAIVALDADGLQIWAEAATGTISGLKAVLIDPGTDPAGAAATTQGSSTGGDAVIRNAAVLPAAPAAGPAIVTRAAWGADESLRTCNADLAPTTLAAAVHHTASTNAYNPEDVPGLHRGFLAYHTRPEADGGRGWCDIGYNFLVDKFGRVFEGRAGSITKAVVGVHTGGSTAAPSASRRSATTAPPPRPRSALLESLSQVIAWKFKTFRILGGSTVTMVSGGGAIQYPEGTVVTFPTVYSHRDAQDTTACPGQNLFDQMPYLRSRVADLANAEVYASPIWSLDSFGSNSSGIFGGGWVLDPESTASLDLTVTVDGAPTRVVAAINRPDLAGPFPGNGTQRILRDTGLGGHARGVRHRRQRRGRQRRDARVRLEDRRQRDAVRLARRRLHHGVAVHPDSGLGARPGHDRADHAARVHPRQPHRGRGEQLPARRRRDLPARGQPRLRRDAARVGGRPPSVRVRDQPARRHQPAARLPDRPGRHSPVGVLDAVLANGAVTVAGWAFDPDTSASIGVHFYVDGGWATATTAGSSRPDVNAAYRITGSHGYAVTIPLAAGPHRICAYAIDTSGGVNPEIGCRTVTVVNAAPAGVIDNAVAASGAVTVTGWAFDPDTTASIGVHFFVDGGWTSATTATGARPDVNAVYGIGGNHGYSATFPLAAGLHRVCAYAIDTGGGTNPEIGCRMVTGR